MTFDRVNKSVYKNKSEIKHYIEYSLQPPEISILVDCKERFYEKRVLDLGCGAGRTTYFLKNFTNKYTGVDYSREMIDICQEQFSDVDFKVCDARDLSVFATEEFDFILFSYNGIDYVGHNDRLDILNEIKRVLKNDGVFVFSSHNRNYKDINRAAHLDFSLNPRKMLANLFAYVVQIQNKKRNIRHESSCDEYEIINDSGNNFALVTYYIDRENQVKQMENIGFNCVGQYDQQGKRLNKADDDIENCWIYYVFTKQEI